jgi:hypothetical protein
MFQIFMPIPKIFGFIKTIYYEIHNNGPETDEVPLEYFQAHLQFTILYCHINVILKHIILR